MSDTQFIDGLIVKAPHEKAPDFVKAKLSINREQMIKWLQMQNGDWINADVKVSRNGKWYAAVDDWKPPDSGQHAQAPAPAPAPAPSGADFADDVPF